MQKHFQVRTVWLRQEVWAGRKEYVEKKKYEIHCLQTLLSSAFSLYDVCVKTSSTDVAPSVCPYFQV